MNSYTSASILLGVAALLILLLLLRRASLGRLSERGLTLGLALLSLPALVFHLGVLEQDPETGVRSLRPPPPHLRELYHYYLGSKYFAELGYEGLYEATVIADQADDLAHFEGSAVVRDLRSYGGISRADVAQRGPQIRGRFAPQRWGLFRQDIEMFRLAVGREWWHRQGWWEDHGYNGTPLVTALLGGLANLDPDAAGSFLNAARWLDLALFPLLLLVVGVAHGPRVAFALSFFWFINPFNDYNFVGGSYLRYSYAYALALGLAFLGRGRSIAAGAFLAVSTALRVFPAVFVLAVVLNHLVRPGRIAALRERGPFYLSFGLTSLLLVGATWGVRTPDGRSAWPAFVDNMQLHAGSFGANQVGLAMPLVHDPENRISAEHGADAWAAAQEERADARRGWILGAGLVGILALAVASRRLDLRDSIFVGLPLLFVLQPAAHYYYAPLGLLPVLFRRDRGAEALLALGFLFAAVTFWPGALGPTDRVFAVASVELGLLLAALLVWRARRETPDRGLRDGPLRPPRPGP